MSMLKLEFSVACDAHRGARPYQEDSVRVWRPDGLGPAPANPVLAVLADGMGGHVAGETASRLASERYVEFFSSGSDPIEVRLERALAVSNEGLGSEIRKNPGLNGMGCTLLAAYVDQEGLRWASVGDSPLLIWRQSSLKRLNEDHSLGALLDQQAAANIITLEEAGRDPRRRVLRSALTGGEIARLDLNGEPVRLEHGDWIIVASDGLETLTGDEISNIVGRHGERGEPSWVVRDLLAEIERKGVVNQDNVSIIAIKVFDPHEAETCVILRTEPGAVTAEIEPPEEEDKVEASLEPGEESPNGAPEADAPAAAVPVKRAKSRAVLFRVAGALIVGLATAVAVYLLARSP